MKKIFFIFIILLFSCKSNINQKENVDNHNEEKEFLIQFIGEENTSLPIYLIESSIPSCDVYETDMFSNDEISFIRKQMIKESKSKWKTPPLSNIKIIPEGFNVDEYEIKDNEYIMGFSHPIFLKNQEYCLFYYRFLENNRTIKEVVAAYKKEDKKWKKVEEYCDWIN